MLQMKLALQGKQGTGKQGSSLGLYGSHVLLAVVDASLPLSFCASLSPPQPLSQPLPQPKVRHPVCPGLFSLGPNMAWKVFILCAAFLSACQALGMTALLFLHCIHMNLLLQ